MPDTCEPAKYAVRPRRVLGWLVVGLLSIQQLAADNTPAGLTDNADFAPAPMDLCKSGSDGYLSGKLFGALGEDIEWHGGNMECGGMLRPGEDGIRLVFAAPRQDERLLIVLGIDGKLDELVDGEHTTNVTIVDETRNRFFSTGRQDRCWSSIKSIQPTADHDNRMLQVAGEVYCAGSLPSLSDNGSVTLSNMKFSGRLLLGESDPN